MDEERSDFLYKILSIQAWKESQKSFALVLSEQDYEFIHFSTEDQLDRILKKYWEAQSYVVLKVEASKLPGDMRYEANPGGSAKYYHLYHGSIPLIAVVEIYQIVSQ